MVLDGISISMKNERQPRGTAGAVFPGEGLTGGMFRGIIEAWSCLDEGIRRWIPAEVRAEIGTDLVDRQIALCGDGTVFE